MLAHQKIPNPQSLSFWQSLTNFVKDKCFAFLKIEVKICTFCWLEIKEEDQEKISQQEDTQRRTKGSCFEDKNIKIFTHPVHVWWSPVSTVFSLMLRGKEILMWARKERPDTVHLICRRDNLKSYIAKVQPHNEIKGPHRVLPNVSQCCKITTTTDDVLANVLLNARLLWWRVAFDFFLQHSDKKQTKLTIFICL